MASKRRSEMQSSESDSEETERTEIDRSHEEPVDEEPPAKKNKSADLRVQNENEDESTFESMEGLDPAKNEETADPGVALSSEKVDDESANNENLEEAEMEATKKRSPELEKFWKVVEEDASDFTGWTYLLQYVDGHADLDDGREAFDAFLYKYPYCYGYWKKYADFEKRKGTRESVLEVFERGVKAIPLSSDLWIHFMNYVKTEFADDENYIRSFFERAVAVCGKEWRSDKLWDMYVKWEISLQAEIASDNKDLTRILKLYDRILLNPTQGLTAQFDMFKDFVKENNPKDMLDVTQFLELRKEVLLEMADIKSAELKAKEGADEDDVLAPPDLSMASQDEETNAIREKIIHPRKKIFKDTEAMVQSRWKFEENIKRPYFHIKPLERTQLKNWSDYIEFEKNEGDAERIELLFERCLIACALYEEYWLMYVDWQGERLKKFGGTAEEKVALVEKIRDIYHRVCSHHLPDKVDLHLSWSAFEETQNDFDRAIEVLDKIKKQHPKIVSLKSRRVNAERRRTNFDAVHALYKEYIKDSSKPEEASVWAIKYSRFLRLIRNDQNSAVKILEDAVLADEKNPKLYLQLLDIFLHQFPLDVSKVLSIFDEALSKKMSEKHRLLFAQRKAEFLEDFGTDVAEVSAARAEYSKLNVELKPNKYSSDYQDDSASIKAADSTYRSSGRSSNGSNVVTYDAVNSSSYAAQHGSQYQQYGARYAYSAYNQQYPSNYYSGYRNY